MRGREFDEAAGPEPLAERECHFWYDVEDACGKLCADPAFADEVVAIAVEAKQAVDGPVRHLFGGTLSPDDAKRIHAKLRALRAALNVGIANGADELRRYFDGLQEMAGHVDRLNTQRARGRPIATGDFVPALVKAFRKFNVAGDATKGGALYGIAKMIADRLESDASPEYIRKQIQIALRG